MDNEIEIIYSGLHPLAPKNRKERQERVVELLKYIMGLIMCMVTMILVLYAAVISEDDEVLSLLITVVFSIAFLIIFAYACWIEMKSEYKKVTICENGVKVKFLFEKERYYVWDAFQEICIVYSRMSPRGDFIEEYHTYISLVGKGEKKNRLDRWKVENPFHYRSIISFIYTDKRYEVLKKYSTTSIVDMRNTPTYQAYKGKYLYIKPHKK